MMSALALADLQFWPSTRLDYAGGVFSREEDIYNPANFTKLLEDWQTAKAKVGS